MRCSSLIQNKTPRIIVAHYRIAVTSEVGSAHSEKVPQSIYYTQITLDAGTSRFTSAYPLDYGGNSLATLRQEALRPTIKTC